MPTTTVLFEDVGPFADLNFPVTFRALVDYGDAGNWDIEAYEGQGARGGWLSIPRDHALWRVFDTYIASSAGTEAVKAQLVTESESAFWSRSGRSFAHAAE